MKVYQPGVDIEVLIPLLDGADCGVESATMLGAYIGSVTHSKPVPLSGVATDPTYLDGTGLPPTDYEGPTGIIAVLNEACREAGIQATSIWAATPHYLAANANPMAMRALLRQAGQIVGFAGDSEELRALEAEFILQVDEAVSESDDLAACYNFPQPGQSSNQYQRAS